MRFLCALLSVVLALCCVGSCRLTVCPVNSLQLLSFNRTLLPLDSVRASSEDEVSNPIKQFVEQYSQPWCSAVNEGSNPNLHINFTFSEPVVITFLQSNGFFNAFVDRFSLQYALGEEGEDFMPYGVLQVPQNFTVSHEEHLVQDSYFTLEQPLVVQRLKLNIHHSILEESNRSCWSLKVLGCTFRQAVAIEDMGEVGSDDGSYPTPCMASYENMPDTIFLEPSDLPLPREEPCPGTQNTESSTAEILTVVLPIALFSILVCAVVVGIGVLSCYIIVSKRLQGSKSKYDPGYERVKVKMLARRRLPVPEDQGVGAQRPFAHSTRKGSVCSNDSGSSNFHYDMPRPITYDVPRTPSQRQQAGASSSNEYRNPLYEDGFVGKESNTYESIPESLNRIEQRMRTASDVLPRPENRLRIDALSRSETRVRTVSDALPRPEKGVHTTSESLPRPDKSVHSASGGHAHPAEGSGGSAEQPHPEGKVHSGAVEEAHLGGEARSAGPQPTGDVSHDYTKVDKSKKNKEDNVPVFEMLYQSSSGEENKSKHSTSATC